MASYFTVAPTPLTYMLLSQVPTWNTFVPSCNVMGNPRSTQIHRVRDLSNSASGKAVNSGSLLSSHYEFPIHRASRGGGCRKKQARPLLATTRTLFAPRLRWMLPGCEQERGRKDFHIIRLLKQTKFNDIMLSFGVSILCRRTMFGEGLHASMSDIMPNLR